jgi:hypothetical protein
MEARLRRQNPTPCHFRPQIRIWRTPLKRTYKRGDFSCSVFNALEVQASKRGFRPVCHFSLSRCLTCDPTSSVVPLRMMSHDTLTAGGRYYREKYSRDCSDLPVNLRSRNENLRKNLTQNCRIYTPCVFCLSNTLTALQLSHIIHMSYPQKKKKLAL